MRSRIILCLIAILSPIQFSAIAGEVNNGGGAAEHNFFVAYLNLEDFILNCTASSFCKIDDRERGILREITSSMTSERSVANQLRFLSGRSTTPNFFDNHGAVRVAKTGDVVGSPIFLNLDLIYPVDANGHVRAMLVSDAIAILVHEFGHHHRINNHQELDLLGAKVSAISEHAINQIWLYNNKISLTSINRKIPLERPDGSSVPYFTVAALPGLIVGGHEIVNGNKSEKYVDISDELTSTLKCPASSLKLVGFNLRDLRWKRGKFTSFDDIQILVRACVLKRCEGAYDQTSARDNAATVEMDLRFYYPQQPEDGYMGISYRPGSMKISQVQDWLPCSSDDYSPSR